MTVRRWIAGGVVFFAAIQLVRPAHPGFQLPGDGDMHAFLDVPPAVDSILHRACYDCHSGSTHWPWYAHVAPVSWLVIHDVRHGRSNLDFSSWSTDPVREPTPDQQLRWMCEEASDGEMPPLPYRVMHPEGRLSDRDKETLCAWTEARRAELR